MSPCPADDHDGGDLPRCVRILTLPASVWLGVLRGSARITNLPGDAEITAAEIVRGSVSFRVQSARFAPVARNALTPALIPQVQQIRND